MASAAPPSPVSGDKRAKLRSDLSGILQNTGGAPEDVAVRLAGELDRTLARGGSAYTRQARALLYNLPRNAPLCRSLVTGGVSPEAVAQFSPDDFLTPEARASKHQLERRQMEAVDVTIDADERQMVQSERRHDRDADAGEEVPLSATLGDAPPRLR